MGEVRIHLNGFGRVVCARCKTDLKGPIASTCEVCKESLGVTGIISLEAGGSGGGPQNPAIAFGSSGAPGAGRPTIRFEDGVIGHPLTKA